MKKKLLSLMLCGTMTAASALLLSGCAEGGTIQAENLMAHISTQNVTETAPENGPSTASTFAVKLLQRCAAGEENTLLSPLSVLAALGMTANGAAGETLSQMEAVLGLPAGELNSWMHSVLQSLPEEKTCTVEMANSIWVRDDPELTVEQPFLQANADYYGAAAYKAPFNDSTAKDINTWVKQNTDNLIDGILGDIPDDAMLYLINALSFDAEWMRIYEDSDVREGMFTTEAGQERTADFMYSQEHTYLRDENAQGFLKYYKGGDYAFAALLPEEGLSVSDYVAGLTGERLLNTLNSAGSETVRAAIPKFETEYDTELSEVLKTLGMADAFDMSTADFSAMGHYGEDSLYISKVLHKTKITVDERGTMAGAVTAVEMASGSAGSLEEPKTVYLDRPFVYLLVNCRTNIPLFIGTMLDTAG